MMLRGLGAVLFAMSLAPLADAQTTEPLPAGWERPTKADLGGANPGAANLPNSDWQARLKNKYRYVRAEGDFNGDDKWDRAEMLVNRHPVVVSAARRAAAARKHRCPRGSLRCLRL